MTLYISYLIDNLGAFPHHAAALLYLILILAASIGYGAAIDHLLPSRRPKSLGVMAALGLAAIALIGSVLNLLRAVSPYAALAVLVGGALCCILAAPKIRSGLRECVLIARQHPLLTALVAGVMALTVLGQFFSPDFLRYDDLPAYLVFPEKMIQTGSLGPEFFSERRLESSLGAIYFLQAVILAGLDRYYLHLIDPVLGYIILWLITYAILKENSIPTRWRLAVLLASGLFVPNLVNLSITILPAPLLLAMIWIGQDFNPSPEVRIGRAVQIGLLAAAAAATKSNVIPIVAVFAALSYVVAIARARSWPLLVESVLAAILTVGSLTAWMISQLHDTGTLLFPLLGKGGFGGQYGNFDFATAHSFGELLDIYWHDGVATPAVLGVGIITLLAVLARAYKDRRNDVLFLLLPALLLANLALCIGTGGVGLNRYSYPAEASALAGALAFGLSALAPVLSRQRSSDATTHFWGLTLIAGLGACLALHVYFVEKYVAQAIRNVGMAALGPALRPAMLYSELEKNDHEAERQIRRLQAALPEGTALLERLDLPFLLDFRRNPIVIADWPGGASPWPGLPLFHGPESLAKYLLSQNLRYVAYAYKNEALFPESDRDSILRDPWTQADAKAAWDFQRNLAALMQTRHLLYDDGTRAIIDLGAPGDSAPGSGNG